MDKSTETRFQVREMEKGREVLSGCVKKILAGILSSPKLKKEAKGKERIISLL